MLDAFKGWRRKAGVIALAVSLLLLCGTVRIPHVADKIGMLILLLSVILLLPEGKGTKT